MTRAIAAAASVGLVLRSRARIVFAALFLIVFSPSSASMEGAKEGAPLRCVAD